MFCKQSSACKLNRKFAQLQKKRKKKEQQQQRRRKSSKQIGFNYGFSFYGWMHRQRLRHLKYIDDVTRLTYCVSLVPQCGCTENFSNGSTFCASRSFHGSLFRMKSKHRFNNRERNDNGDNNGNKQTFQYNTHSSLTSIGSHTFTYTVESVWDYVWLYMCAANIITMSKERHGFRFALSLSRRARNTLSPTTQLRFAFLENVRREWRKRKGTQQRLSCAKLTFTQRVNARATTATTTTMMTTWPPNNYAQITHLYIEYRRVVGTTTVTVLPAASLIRLGSQTKNESYTFARTIFHFI